LINQGLISANDKIHKVERQVVAGFKYRIVASIGDVFREIVAYKKIDNSIQVMSNQVVSKPA